MSTVGSGAATIGSTSTGLTSSGSSGCIGSTGSCEAYAGAAASARGRQSAARRGRVVTEDVLLVGAEAGFGRSFARGRRADDAPLYPESFRTFHPGCPLCKPGMLAILPLILPATR